MKLFKNIKVILLAFFLIGGAQILTAQEVGIRFGNSIGSNVALDAVFSAGKFSRIHADLAFGHGVGLEGLYDFIHRPLGAQNLSWYLGVGLGGFFPSKSWEYKDGWGNDFMFGFPAEIGIEYKISSIPIAIGVDWRPMFVLINKTDFYARGFGFNVRYCF